MTTERAEPKPVAVTVGSSTVDIITVVADRDIERVTMANATASFLLLEQGRKIEAESITIHPGGGAINCGVCLSRMGFAVTPLVKLGDDLNAAKVLETFASEGLCDRLVIRTSELGTGIAVMVSSHDRNATIFTFRGANTLIRRQDIPGDAFDGAAVVHVAGLSNESADSYADIVAQAKGSGAFVSNNPGIRQLTSRREAFLQAAGDIDLLTINRVEAEALMPALCRERPQVERPALGPDVPELARRGLSASGFDMDLFEFAAGVHKLGPRFVAITDGTDGAYLSVEGELLFCPPYPVEAAGTAGAGDAFAATVAAKLARKCDPGDALRAAAVNAACVVGYVDTQSGLQEAEALAEILDDAPAGFTVRRLG